MSPVCWFLINVQRQLNGEILSKKLRCNTKTTYPYVHTQDRGEDQWGGGRENALQDVKWSLNTHAVWLSSTHTSLATLQIGTYVLSTLSP